ncbi:MAG TPA: sugar transferase [Candidatus Dormibacteraeota bacterium]|nr:sugar transferase [Candidatus Dormibacteraeota bacterium]
MGVEQTWHDGSTPSAGPGERSVPRPGYEVLSRLLNVAVAVAVLILLSPLWLAIAGLIRATSPGPALFRRTVAGRFGRPFTYYKFRTMVDGDDSHHRAWLREFVVNDAAYQHGTFKVVGDRRITGVGKVLRRLSLDEVPQMLNVLRGEMSLVGPRPPIMAEFELYDDRARCRLAVRPGITGLYQVTARSQVPFSRMVDIDLEYIRRRSLALDVSIMLRTAVVMLAGRGAG